ncbi:hypothetical protein [Streptomyces sp. NPDC092307]|uniref:hypothetical protein n=1 Tax=Streptomyces sp. NPDC092307 TaxID=3366013 RepID=UPI0037FDADBD
MAATISPDGSLIHACFPISKVEKSQDGNIFVYGRASDGSVDSDEQIVDPGWTASAIQEWLSTGGNVRVQHNPRRDPAGIGVEASTDSNGATWLKSLIVEPVAKALVEAGALRAYSVGIARPEVVQDPQARGGRIVGGDLYEISLVDRPANRNCGFHLVKAAEDGSVTWVGTVFGDSGLVNRLAGGESASAESGNAGFAGHSGTWSNALTVQADHEPDTARGAAENSSEVDSTVAQIQESASAEGVGTKSAASDAPPGRAMDAEVLPAGSNMPILQVLDDVPGAAPQGRGDSEPETAADRLAHVVKGSAALGAPLDVGALHDLVCAAYDPMVVDAGYADAQGSIGLAHWAEKAFDAAVKSSLEDASQATQLWTHAATLQNSDRELVARVRREFHERFKEANAGLGPLPEPGQLTADRFRRPYLSEGRAIPGTDYRGPHRADLPNQPVDASRFRREYLTEGHAAPSPGSGEGPAPVPPPAVSGSPERVQFDELEAVRSAMRALHDHISISFPALCPMQDGPGLCGTPPVGSRPVATPMGTPVPGPKTASDSPSPLLAEQSLVQAEVAGPTGWAGSLVHEAEWPEGRPDVQDSGCGDVVTALEWLRLEVTSELKMMAEALDEVRSLVRSMADPADAPLDVPVSPPPDPPQPGDVVALAVKAAGAGPDQSDPTQRARLLVLRELDQQCRTSSDPAQRESAWDALHRLRGLS